MPSLRSSWKELSLRRTRKGLLRRFDRIDGPSSLHAFQVRLAEEIARVEPIAFADKRSPQRRHLRLLRLFGDGLAWRFLHPHSIRQLARNQPNPPALTSQGDAFAQTMDAARRYSEKGLPALVADLTHCLRIGDVVVCADPERPLVVECGGSLVKTLGRGRKGRQMLRAMAVSELLHDGVGQLPGEEHAIRTIEIDTPVEESWAAVQACTERALSGRQAIEIVAPGDVIFALDACEETVMLKTIREAMAGFEHLRIGAHTRKNDEPDPGIPPPVAWPLPAKLRLALLEGDVTLMHVVAIDALAQPTGDDTKVRLEGTKRRVDHLVVEHEETRCEVSPRIFDEVVYGFQAIDSCRTAMIEMVKKAAVAEGPSVGSRPAKLIEVRSEEDARDLVADPAKLDQYGYVALPLSLYEKLLPTDER